jgi:hypothetical protein
VAEMCRENQGVGLRIGTLGRRCEEGIVSCGCLKTCCFYLVLEFEDE